MSIQPHALAVADGNIISNAAILGGTPVFAGTRVPVSALFDYLADNLSLHYFLESFPTVLREQAIAVIRYGPPRITPELGA